MNTRRRETVEQIASILKQQQAGRSIPEACRVYDINSQTLYRWKSKRKFPQ